MDETKHPLTSVGIMGPLISLIVYFVNLKWPGLGITEASAGELVGQIAAVVAALTGIYGRWKATKAISLKAPIA